MSEYNSSPNKRRHQNSHNSREGLNIGKFFIGILLTIFGILFLIQELTGIGLGLQFNWNLIWPLLIVLIGFSLINLKGFQGKVIGILLTLIIVGLIVATSLGVFNCNSSSKDGTAIEKSSQLKENRVEIDKFSNIDLAEIQIRTGGGKFKISSNQGQYLVNGVHKSDFFTLNQKNIIVSSQSSKKQKTKISTELKDNWNLKKKINQFDLEISPEVPIKLLIETGVSSFDLNLSNLKIKQATIKAGASDLDIEIGDKLNQSKLDVKSGASSINLTIPKSLGVRLEMQSALSSQNLERLNKTKNDMYESPNYSSKSKKIKINLDTGVSSFDIDWK